MVACACLPRSPVEDVVEVGVGEYDDTDWQEDG